MHKANNEGCMWNKSTSCTVIIKDLRVENNDHNSAIVCKNRFN